MPKVPTYEPNQVRNREVPTSVFTANATPEMFGAKDFREISKLADTIGNSAEELGSAFVKKEKEKRDQRDQTMARDALNKAEDEARRFMSDIYQRKGEAGIDVYADTSKALDDIRKKYAAELKNVRQRLYFTSSYDSGAKVHLDKSILFQTEQRDRFEKDTLAAQNQNEVESAILNRNDQRLINASEAQIAANTRALNKGQGKDIIDKAVENAVFDLHATIFATKTKEDPEAALAYLNNNWDRFDPRTRDKLKQEVNELATDAQVRRVALEMDVQGIPYDEQLKQADKVDDVKKAKALKEQIEERYKTKELQKTIQKKRVTENAWIGLRQDPADFRIPYESLEKAEWQAMESYKKHMIEKDAGFGNTTVMGMYAQYSVMSDAELKDKSVTEILALMPYMEEKRWNGIFDRYQDLRLGKNAKSEAMTTTRTWYQMMQGTLDQMGIDTSAQGTKAQRERGELFMQNAETQLEAFEIAKGSKATYEEKRKILDKMSIEGRVRVWGADKQAFAFEKQEGEDFYVQDIPAEHEEAIINVLRKKKMPVTKKAIQNMYTRMVLADE